MPHNTTRTKYSIVLSISFVSIVTFLLFGCAPTSKEVGTSSFRDGVLAARTLTDQYGKVNQPEANNYLHYMGDRLTQALRSSNRPHAPFRITLLRTNSPLAGAPGGGEIFISIGLIHLLSNESEFAFVLAHEYAHEVLGHLRKDNDTLSSDKELEADRFAVSLVAAAGYNPYSAVKAIESVYQYLKTSQNTLTHPGPEVRLKSLFSVLASSNWSPPGTIDRRDFQLLKRITK